MVTNVKSIRDKGKKSVAKKAVALERLTVEYVPVSAVSPNSYNPNRQSDHDFELLCRSMTEDGFTQPIIVHADSMTIVDGEHRWRAAAKLGFSEIPIVKVAMTPEQMRIATLRHNRARGSEDIDLTAELLRDLRELGALDWAQDSLMLDDVELQSLLDDLSAADIHAGKEYGDSWDPATTAVYRSDQANADGNYTDQYANKINMTPEAVEKIRENEKTMQKAKNEEERQAVAKSLDIYRLALVFSGEEAVLVRRVLGESPAMVILDYCKTVSK